MEIDLSKNSENSWTEIRSLRLNPNKPAKYLTLVTEESRVEGKKNTERNPKNLRKHLSSIRLSRKIQSGIDTDFYEKITKKFLDDFYPKKCTNPACEERILDKEISTRPDIIRCSKCHQQQSRLSYTPLMALKLPLYMFGVVFHESFLQFPKVLTATEISKRLGIEYKSALKLKRRFQLFCSDQLLKYKALTYQALEEEYRGFKLDPNTETDVAPKMGLKPYVSADACVLYSTSQRANKGRSRYRHGGLTSSIYMSKNLGGKQIGTLVHGICVQNGPAFFESVSDTKANTIGPLLVEQIPYSVPLFTDQGYPYLYNLYKNHRMINHSRKSKESRSGFSRNRFQKHNVHSQTAEGNFRLLKSSFSSYSYIKPEYSKLYLDEFSFIKTAKFFGLDCITEGCLGSQFSWEGRTAGAGSATVVRIGQEKYHHRRSSKETKKWLLQAIKDKKYQEPEREERLRRDKEQNKYVLNSAEAINRSRKALAGEMKRFNDFWSDNQKSKHKRKRELKYENLSFKIWNSILYYKETSGENPSVQYIADRFKLDKRTLMIILRKWLKYGLIQKRKLYNKESHDRRVDFSIVQRSETLPHLLYTQFPRIKNQLQKEVR